MPLRIKYLSISKYIYELAFSIVIIETYLSCSSMSLHINFHLNEALLLCSLMLLIKIFIDKHKLYEYFFVIFIIIISLIITYCSKDATILVDVSLIIGAKRENFLKLMKIFFYIGSLLSGIFILGAILGIFSNISRIGHSGIRYSLGFSYPVELSESILILSILYSIIHFNKIKWVRLFIYLLLSYFILKVPNTRMDYYCMLILIFIDFIKKVCPRVLNKFPFNLSWLSLIIMSVLSVFSAVFFNTFNNISLLYSNINYNLENRLFFSYYWLSKFPYSLFGRNMKIYYHPFYLINGIRIEGYLDQSVIHLIVNYGWIIFLIFIFVYTVKMLKLYNNNLNYFVLLFMIIVIRGFFDVNLLQLFGNPFLIIIFTSLNGLKYNNHMLKDKIIKKDAF